LFNLHVLKFLSQINSNYAGFFSSGLTDWFHA